MGSLVRSRWGKNLGLVVGLGAAVVVMLVWGAPGALAAGIGEQNLAPNGGSPKQLGQNVPVFQGDAGGNYVLSPSQAGTITSWSFLSGGVATGKHFELAVLAPVDQSGMSWRLIATSAPVAVTTPTGADAVNGPFPVQIPIDVGYRIALMPVDDSITPVENGQPGVDGIRYFSQPFNGGLGSSQQVPSTADNGQVVPIHATIDYAAPPTNVSPPSISGTPQQLETLTGNAGVWQNRVDRYSYAWLRCAPDGTGCAGIPGANSATYTLTGQDVGFTMRLRVIASNAYGDSPPTESAPTAVVQRGVITAKLTVSPHPSCTGIPTTLDASGSVSPDGIKSYSFRLINLYAPSETEVERVLGHPSPSEADLRFYEALLGAGFADNQVSQDLIDTFGDPPQVTDKPSVTLTFDWNRPAIYNPNLPPGVFEPPSPDVLARDDFGVVVVVTDNAGHTAQAEARIEFAQPLSSDSRAKCPKGRLRFVGPNAVLTGGIAFAQPGGKPSGTMSCRTRVACVGSIIVIPGRSSSRAVGAADPKPLVLAAGFFNIPPHRKRKVTLTLTKLGKSRLHRGAHLPVRITVTSVSPTGRTRTHVYSQLLTR